MRIKYKMAEDLNDPDQITLASQHNLTLKHLLFKVNNKKARKRWEICSKLTIKTPERCH